MNVDAAFSSTHLFLTAEAMSPTRSLCGPTSTELQFRDCAEGQFVNPSWCLAVNITYLKKHVSINAFTHFCNK